jgi:peptide/nickel transport system substrate-binding protein
MKNILFVILAVLLVSGMIFSSCASPSSSTSAPISATATSKTTSAQTTTNTPQYGGTLMIICTSPLAGLGTPYTAGSGYTDYARPAIETLLGVDAQGNLVPKLATSWQVASDGKSVTFNLRKGVKFHDGTDFNAEAAKYNILHQQSGSYKSYGTSIDVLDDYTIRVNLSQWAAPFLYELSRKQGMIISPTAAAKTPAPERVAYEQMIGTGPFKFVDWQKDVIVKYQKFDGYWNTGRPYLDNLNLGIFTDATTALMSLQSGQGQILMYTDPKTGMDLKTKGYEVAYTPKYIFSLVPDGGNADSPFADQRVREAVEYAIDKKTIAEGLGYGYWPAWGSQIYGVGDKLYDSTLQDRTFNINKAKQLLAEAGYSNGFKTTIIVQTADNGDRMTALQSYLAAVGITVQLDVCDQARYISYVKSGWKNGLMVAKLGVANPATNPISFLTPYTSSQPNVSMYRPADFMKLYDKTVGTSENQQYLDGAKSLSKYIYDNAMDIPLWEETQVAASKGVHDLNPCTVKDPSQWTPDIAWIDKK